MFRAGWRVLSAAAAALVAVIVAIGWTLLSPDVVEEKAVSTQAGVDDDVTTDDLTKVARTRVFFGHQSVGMNILDAVPAVYAEHGVPAPPIEQDAARPGPAGGFVAHTFLGRNEDPLGKIRDFDSTLRGGMASQVDVAMMKLCYIDIRSDTDVDALFTAYRDTIAALERDYPKVAFVKATLPLTTDAGLVARLKARLGRDARFGQAENVVREKLNRLIREQYAGKGLLDLAALESTKPDGMMAAARYDGQTYHSLFDGYAADEGHLNATGARRVAQAWLKLVAEVSPR